MLDLDLLQSPFYIIKKLQREAMREFGYSIFGRVLDIGCGKRPYRQYIAASEYVGMDNDSVVKPDIVGVIEAIPFPDRYFDAALCNEVLEHVKDPVVALRELGRVVKTGGKVYLSVPMTWCLHYEPNDYFRYTKYGIQALAEATGFKILSVKRIGGFFSMTWQLWADFVFFKLTRFMPSNLALILIAPKSLGGFVLGKLLDRFDKRYALGWVALLEKYEVIGNYSGL